MCSRQVAEQPQHQSRTLTRGFDLASDVLPTLDFLLTALVYDDTGTLGCRELMLQNPVTSLIPRHWEETGALEKEANWRSR